jgi:CubicO group peptidase (beta-lactamase class C family)
MEPPLINMKDYSNLQSRFSEPEKRHLTLSYFGSLQAFPTIISRGINAMYDIPLVPNGQRHLEAFRIKLWPDEGEMDLPRFLYEMRADAFLIMKNGKLVYEVYPRQLKRDQTHELMSASKTFASIIIANLIAQGRIHLETEVSEIIPEIREGFRGATLSNLMNMNVCIEFEERYVALERIWLIESALGDVQSKPPSLRDYLQSGKNIGRDCNKGNYTRYNTALTDVLGWIIQHITGFNYNYAVSEYIFKHVGASRDGIGLNDYTGFGRAGGGVSLTARDAALVFSAFANDGVSPNGVSIIPAGYIDQYIYEDPQATVYGHGTMSSWKYSHQLVFNEKGGMAHLGVGGQLWYSNKETGLTIIQMGSIESENFTMEEIYINALLDMTDIVNQLVKEGEF